MDHFTKPLPLLRRILMEIQEEANYDDAALDMICSYMADKNAPSPLPWDRGLQESILYLQYMMDLAGLTSLEQIWSYLQDQRREAKTFVTELMDRVDRQRISEELDLFISFLDPAPLPAAISAPFLADRLLVFLNEELPLTFPFHGTYQRPSTTYFQQFAEQKRVDQMYVLEYYSEQGIEECTVNEIVNKLAVAEPSNEDQETGLAEQQGRPIHFAYDRLLELLLDRETQIDFSFKVGMTSWLLLTQLDHYELMADSDVQSFEGLVYFFLADTLADKQWSILKSPTHLSWVTSDKPGFVIDTHAEAKQSIFSADLLRHLKGIRSFYYPLSKDYCLRLEPATTGKDMTLSQIRFEESSEQEVNAVNEMTMSVGKEMVISSDKRVLESFQK